MNQMNARVAAHIAAHNALVQSQAAAIKAAHLAKERAKAKLEDDALHVGYDEIYKALEGDEKITDDEFRTIIKRLQRIPNLTPGNLVKLHERLKQAYPLKGPFVYPHAADLEGTDKVGSGSCPVLIQWYTKGLNSQKVKTWRQGIRVRGNKHLIKPGTAIATFVEGFYPNQKHGNHVAFYLDETHDGIVMMDQWIARPKVGARLVKFKGKNGYGDYNQPSNNGDAFSVVMVR